MVGERATLWPELEAALAVLAERKDAWAQLPVGSKIRYLVEARRVTAAVADQWVAAAAQAKGIPDGSPSVGEEWLSGPWALLFALNRLAETLRALARGEAPPVPRGALRTRPDGQVVVRVFPQSTYDRLLVSGVRAEVWQQPDVQAETLSAHMGSFYRQSAPAGRVTLVLGAGNVASIPPLDVLTLLFNQGSVCLLKMSPVNDYLGPYFERIFAALIADGFLRIAYGGGDVGAYLCAHARVDAIHITGSAATHDAIVFGSGEEGVARKARNAPLLAKPIASELGNVSPTIVVPGPWSAADLQFQAEQIATQKLHNAGCNCVAAQVLVLPAAWNRTSDLRSALRRVLQGLPARAAYYPGSAARQAALLVGHEGAERAGAALTILPDLDPGSGDAAFAVEAFGATLAETLLPGDEPATFLREAVTFCNERLWGTLGANIIVHPATMRALGPLLEEAIADLRYGCVAVNAWTGLGFLLAPASWGAFPGHTLDDIGSGIGVVHNTLLFDRPQKSVVHAPFYPFPRGLLHGQVSLLPRPPWFVTNPRAGELGRKLVEFEADPGPRHLPGIFLDALRG